MIKPTSKVWKKLNRLFEPACWNKRKVLAPYWEDEISTIPGVTKDYSEYRNKCRWVTNLEEGKISKNFKENPSFCVQLMSAIDEARQGNLDSHYGDNKLVIMAAVLKDGLQLEFASERLQDNYDIVFAAVSQNGHALRWASERLRRTHAIIEAALENNEMAIVEVPEDLRQKYIDETDDWW
jgi:hypothetical protein